MRLAVMRSRVALVDARGAIGVEAVSAGEFLPDPRAIAGPAAAMELPSEAVDLI